MDRAGKQVPCFVQVNIGEEAQKGGCAIAELPALLAAARGADIPLAGLMCVPPLGIEPAPFFALLAKLADEVQFGCRPPLAQRGPLASCFLHAVLAEHALARRYQRQDAVGRMGLADRDERDLRGIAPGDLRGGGDPGADVFEQGGWLIHAAVL
jgi:hypothetical protein